MSNPKPQTGRNVDPLRERPTCGKCGKKHVGKCLVVTNSCDGCGKGGHMVKYCPNVRSEGKGNEQTLRSGPNSEAPKRNHFYAFKDSGKQENFPDFVMDMLQLFSVNVYSLLDPGATLYFFTPLVDRKFDVLPNVSIEPFSVCTPMGDSVVALMIL